MAIQQDILTGSVGVGATVTSLMGYVTPILGVLVAVGSLVAIVYSIMLKRKQLAALDK